MGFPLCRLMDMTGPLGFPTDIAMGRVQGGDRFQVAQMSLRPNDEIQRTLFEFDNQSFVPFDNPLQLRVGLNGPHAQDLGETILDANGVGQGELTAQFRPNGIIGGPFYELTYKLLPG
jgi:hypothetical protein